MKMNRSGLGAILAVLGIGLLKSRTGSVGKIIDFQEVMASTGTEQQVIEKKRRLLAAKLVSELAPYATPMKEFVEEMAATVGPEMAELKQLIEGGMKPGKALNKVFTPNRLGPERIRKIRELSGKFQENIEENLDVANSISERGKMLASMENLQQTKGMPWIMSPSLSKIGITPKLFEGFIALNHALADIEKRVNPDSRVFPVAQQFIGTEFQHQGHDPRYFKWLMTYMQDEN